MAVFLDDWTSIDDLVSDFEDESVRDYEIIVALYWDPWGCSGDSYVLARKGGFLYENEASHCSCRGLEGSWEPQEVTTEYLRQRQGAGGGTSWERSDVQEVINTFLASIN